jgi:hypothetical protein
MRLRRSRHIPGNELSLPGRRSSTGKRLLGLLALSATVILTVPSPAQADDGPVSFGVSAPADLQQVHPGEVVKTWVGVSNQLDQPMRLQLRLVTMRAQDNGKFQVVDTPDPMWAGRVQGLVPVDLPPKGSVRMPLEVHMPDDLVPDIYVAGFLVEPDNRSAAPGAILVRSQLSTYVTFEVAGPRHRDISAGWLRVPHIQFNRHVTSTFRVKNAGVGSAYFRGQVRVNTMSDKNVSVVLATGEQPLLLPSHTSRTVSYSWKASGLLYMGRSQLEVAYPTGLNKLATIERVSPMTIVIPPETLAIPLALFVLVLLWRSWVRRGRLAKLGAQTLAAYDSTS